MEQPNGRLDFNVHRLRVLKSSLMKKENQFRPPISLFAKKRIHSMIAHALKNQPELGRFRFLLGIPRYRREMPQEIDRLCSIRDDGIGHSSHDLSSGLSQNPGQIDSLVMINDTLTNFGLSRKVIFPIRISEVEFWLSLWNRISRNVFVIIDDTLTSNDSRPMEPFGGGMTRVGKFEIIGLISLKCPRNPSRMERENSSRDP
jgi:hypothetical protein